MATHPEAFVLLHIPEVSLSTSNTSEHGTLALECVTLATDSTDKDAPLAASLSASDRSLILVLRLGTLELPLDPARAISLHIAADGTRTYTFHSDVGQPGVPPADKESSFIRLTVPIPSRPDTHRAESVEALDHILAQYADFDWETEGGPYHDAPPHEDGTEAPNPTQEDLRGKLVLMDEASGEIVGELPNRVNIKEDPALADKEKATAKDGEPAPVMVELPEEMYDAYTGHGASVVPYVEPSSELEEAREIFVRAIPPEDQDWMTKSATLISQAISSSTSLLLHGLTSATNYYIGHSTPSPTPKGGVPPPPQPRALLLLSHPRTQSTLSSAYAISGQAVKVSSKTAAIVEDLIKRAVGATIDKGKSTAGPPVPPRPQASTATSAASVPSVASTGPPPPYPGAPDVRPPLPPRHSAAPSAAPSAPGPAPPLPPRGKSPLPGNVPGTPAKESLPASGTSTPASTSSGKPVGRSGKLALSANLILATVDDSLRRTFDVGSERATAVVAHKYGPEAAKSTHLATHTARNVTLVYIDMRGFARKALIKKAGKTWIQAKLGGGREMSGVVVDREAQSKKYD
ncbi:hypothetical protein BD309DRAFT_893678 [Dichomitus squalens]|uniref:Senescence domain-containing protein n=1 Tax=Dichomitus squalens TaxID=114155 RepID=A0A4Q9PRS0_9APHY|nr:hypothetical protein BD309DRAFT_893678 [Dichomitus squalens]TBU57080.1 hypothetical protein BD310DRAFT_1040126 [Dichomitus squalens]